MAQGSIKTEVKRMRQKGLLWLWSLVCTVMLLGHVTQVLPLAPVRVIDQLIFDTRMRLDAPNQADARIAIVDIDDASLTQLGRWPWNRGILADLVERLFNNNGIALLGLDVLLPEPDKSGGLDLLTQVESTFAQDSKALQDRLLQLRQARDYDAALARALGQHPVVLSYALSQQTPPVRVNALPDASAMAGTFDAVREQIPVWNGFTANVAGLQAAATGIGHIATLTDADGVTRRVPLLAQVDGQVYESFPLALARVALGDPLLVPGPSVLDKTWFSQDLEWLTLASAQQQQNIPVDSNGAGWLRFSGPAGVFERVSALDVLTQTQPIERLRGRIVLLGTSAAGLVDLRTTPMGTQFPGVEIHATALSNILNGNGMARTRLNQGAEAILVLLLGVGLTLLLPRLGVGAAVSVILASVLGVLFVVWQLGHVGQVVFAAAAILQIMLIFGASTLWSYTRANRSKQQIAQLFGQYVPPALVDEMARDPLAYNMAGRSAELTILFSDIRGFTSISERMSASELAAMMNAYLDAMTEVIQSERGTLDKYIGDAIMAFWGAPLAQADHAQRAVNAALGMQRRLQSLNESFVAQGWPALKIGIGINTGVVVVGDMGSKVRKAYTVMGDAVNLASRLESISKVYGVGVVVGQATVDACPAIPCRVLDRIRVKGKTEPVTIAEPVDVTTASSTETAVQLAQWNEFLQAYRARNWSAAQTILASLPPSDQAGPLVQLYQQRLNALRENDPGQEWDGVTTFETK